jgi:hypothetical protein
VLICAGLGLTGLSPWLRGHSRGRSAAWLSVLAAAFAIGFVYLINAELFNVLTAVRFSCPVLIGGFPVICLAWARLSGAGKLSAGARRAMLAAGLFAVAIIVFAGSFETRARRARLYHAILAFPLNSDYGRYANARLSREDSAYYLSLQLRMAPGATALAWTVAPFRLSFARNRLWTVSEGGLINPLLRFPAGISGESLERYLRLWNVRYVMMETDPASAKDSDFLRSLLTGEEAMYRKWGAYNLYLREQLFELATRSRVLYRDNRMLLFELAHQASVDTETIMPQPNARSR